MLGLAAVPKEFKDQRSFYRGFVTDTAISHLAKLVAKETGDIRIAFDTLTSALGNLEDKDLELRYEHIDRAYK